MWVVEEIRLHRACATARLLLAFALVAACSSTGSAQAPDPLGLKAHLAVTSANVVASRIDNLVPIEILQRTNSDIALVAAASLLNNSNLDRTIGGLLTLVLVVGGWGWSLRRRMRRQTRAMEEKAAAEASVERRNAQLEVRRSQILADINSSRPLAELLEQITELVSFSLEEAFCWCELTDGTRMGKVPTTPTGLRYMRREISTHAGETLGTLFVALDATQTATEDESGTLASGVRLATLAIETRKLYKDLVYRSEFDVLTDIYNRASLDRYLEERIEESRKDQSIFCLIYVDLDEFKQMNDLYGHRVGDLYLQEVSIRMKRQLRSGDMLARLGGDEFAALVPVVRSRSAAEEIAQRLERSFDAPFAVEGFVLRGAASVGIAVYPEDGNSTDSLLSAADAAMYVAKHTKHAAGIGPSRLRKIRYPEDE